MKKTKFIRLRLFVATLFVLFWCLVKPKEILEMYELADEAMSHKRIKESVDRLHR